jgi:chorismate mutase
MLNSLRKKIDQIDTRIVELLLKRYRAVKQISSVKQQNNIPIEDKKREEQALKTLLADCSQSREKRRYIRTILETIQSASKQIQKGNK